MFEIKFKIPKRNLQELERIDFKEFDSKYKDIEEQFALNFNGVWHGVYLDELEIGQEWIILWFELLLESLLRLRCNEYVAFSIPEKYNNWMVFMNENDSLKISTIRVDLSTESKSLFVTKPFERYEETYIKDIKILKKSLFMKYLGIWSYLKIL
ncbi:MAG: hypothetical protein KAX49_20460 [Halanaerobiales bacterium]|nr:hypothetical protein [Halanaerobiales bacterium]